MNIEQIGLQLGIAGLLVVVGYKIAILLISRWSATEKERTSALTTGLQQIAASINQHSVADLQSHATLGEAVARIDGKLDALLDQRERYTPIHGVPTGVPRGEFGDEHSTPVEVPRSMRTQINRPRGSYMVRKPTNGEDT